MHVDSTARRLKNGRYRVQIGETIGFRWTIAQAFVPWATMTVGRSCELRVTVTPELLTAARASVARRSTR